jgi:hypothetical protein
MPIQHPGSIVRGQWAKEPCQETYLRRLWAAIKGREPWPDTDVSKPPPNSKLFPTLDDLKQFTEESQDYDAVSIDIENAGPHIICIGFTLVCLQTGNLGTTICVRFRRRGGRIYWTNRRELLVVVAWLYTLLAEPRLSKVFHNGVVYDVPILEGIGFRVEGRLIDTLNLQHTCYPEMGKGLQFTSTLYLWAPCWKLLVEEKEEAEGKG